MMHWIPGRIANHVKTDSMILARRSELASLGRAIAFRLDLHQNFKFS